MLLPIETMVKDALATSERTSSIVSHGERLLPCWIDRVGRETPEKVWLSIPRSADLQDGFRDFQYRHLVAAIDTVAWWIESIIGRSTDFETVAYLGYIIFGCFPD